MSRQQDLISLANDIEDLVNEAHKLGVWRDVWEHLSLAVETLNEMIDEEALEEDE